jgi:hypothetical protein
VCDAVLSQRQQYAITRGYLLKEVF